MVILLSSSSRIHPPEDPSLQWLHPDAGRIRSHNLLKFQGLLARGRCDHGLLLPKIVKPNLLIEQLFL